MRRKNFRGKVKERNLKNIILEHINNNLRDYVILTLFFIVGIILGVLFVNNANNSQKEQISSYINGIVTSLKGEYEIDNITLLKSSIINNIKLAIILWIAGSTVIGVPFVYGIITYKGFCLGYTSASIIGVLGLKKGITFLLTSLFLQNILFIPCLLAIGVSGLKLYRSIMKDKRKENIKIEIYRHTIFSVLMLIGLILSSVIETYVSSVLFTYVCQNGRNIMQQIICRIL